MEKITIDKKNDTFQILDTYKRNRAKRTKAGKIFVEGVIPINLLLENSYKIDSIVYHNQDSLSDWAKGVIIKACPDRICEMTKELMDELSTKDESSEIIVIANQPPRSLENLDVKSLKRLLVLDRPSNQGNLGAIIRSCDAFGIDAILISGHSVDHFDQKTITSSRGTVFKIPIYKLASNKELTDLGVKLRSQYNFIFYGTSAKGNRNLREGLDRQKNICLIIGNETTGMNEFLFNESDEVLTIPMEGAATSLNISCAATVLLYEMTQSS